MDYLQLNRESWDEIVPHHIESEFYELDRFRAGHCRLHGLEVDLLGDVTGRSLLHLQCHFGLDTLSWARRGARVTGVDFAPKAIRAATDLAAELDIEARFIESEVFQLPEVLDETFDIVFTSYGAICWLPELEPWAALVARYLEPGGVLAMVEVHPFAWCLEEQDDRLVLTRDYFDTSPELETAAGSYACPDAKTEHNTSVTWAHSMAEIVQSLIDAGLVIERLAEYPEQVYKAFPSMQRGDDRYWRSQSGGPRPPQLLGIMARRPR